MRLKKIGGIKMFGFFGKKGSCSICNEKASREIKEGYICNKCYMKCKDNLTKGKDLKEVTLDEAKNAMEKTQKKELAIRNFSPTRKISNLIYFDDEKEVFMLPKTFVAKARIYKYSELLEYEILEDGESIQKGGLGRAVVGGVLFGGIGAVVGGLTANKKIKRAIKSYKIKLILDNKAVPVEYINLLASPTRSDSLVFKGVTKMAEEIVGVLKRITHTNNKNETTTSQVTSEADEIMKFKKLFDAGVITEEEFIGKKKQILGL